MADDQGFYLGSTVGDQPERVVVDPSDLTTHGVTVGMTGSGKTGLLIGLLEESLLAGIPAVVFDPKGDLTNLFLTFPKLRPEDFAPWVDPEAARREGITVEELATKTAEKWKAGITRDGQDLDRIQKLRDGSEMRLFTPGSDAGLAVNVLSGFEPPSLSWDDDAEVLRERISASISALLTRAGEDADPLQSAAHIFLCNLLEDRWRAGESPDLSEILGYLLHPPFAKLGVLHVDKFFPPDKRQQTVQRLNSLLASPAFAAWQVGVPLNLEKMLKAPAGKTPLVMFYTAHLNDKDRQMFSTLALGEVISWMRSQRGTGSLRLLVVMDEVWGLMPPHPANPPTKQPMLTLLKQARAFGVGLVVATQNPVDLDYKGLTNAGFWSVGRLSTERDKDRLLDGMDMVAGGATRKENDQIISALKPRQFLMRNVHDKGGAKVFSTRWVLSYLRGPLTRDEIRTLVSEGTQEAWAAKEMEQAAATAPAGGGAAPGASAASAPAVSAAAPRVPDGVPVYYADPAALLPDRPQGALAGAKPGPPKRYRPALLGRASVRFDERKAGLDHTQTEWRVIFPLEGTGGWRWSDEDAPDLGNVLSPAPLPGVSFAVLPPALEEAKTYKGLAKDLSRTLHATERLELFVCRSVKAYSNVGETREHFAERIHRLAEDAGDEKIAALREKYVEKRRKLEDKIERESLDVERLQDELSAAKRDTLLTLGESVLGALLGGRRSTRVLSQTNRKRRTAGSTAGRLRKEESQLESAEADSAALEEKLSREVDRIREDCAEKTGDIESMPVTLEKADIRVEEVALLWIPDAE